MEFGGQGFRIGGGQGFGTGLGVGSLEARV